MKKYSHLIGKEASYIVDEEPAYPSSPNGPVVTASFQAEKVVGLLSRVSVDGKIREEYAIMESGRLMMISLLFFDEVYQPDKQKSPRTRRKHETS